MDQPPRPTDAELEILTVLWALGPSTVRDVYKALLQRKEAQYSTVLKFMQIMTEKGTLLRDESQRAHIYRPACTREATQRQLAGDLLHRAFAGSAKELLIGALGAKKSTPQELAEMRRLLDEFEKGKR
jgi:BlaI family penicillinase repressor